MYSIYAGDELLYSDIFPNETRKVTSPTLKMAVDEAGSLEFTVSEVNKCYTKLERMKTIITVKKFDIPIWDGRILREDRDYNKNKKMYVEGSFAFLNDSVQPLKEYANVTFQSLIESILSIHNDIVKDSARYLYYGGITDDFNPVEVEYWITAYESTIDVVKKIVEYFECHYAVKKNPTNGHNELFFFKDYYRYSKQTVTFSKNLMDYTDNYDLSKMATVLIPLCKTSRESSDTPLSIGTTIDLTEELPYSQDTGYGVLCAQTSGWAQTLNVYGPDNSVNSDYKMHTVGLSGVAQEGTGLFRWNVLNLRKYVLEDQSEHVKPYAFTVYPLTYIEQTTSITRYPVYTGSMQLFTGDFDVYPSVNVEGDEYPEYDTSPVSDPTSLRADDFDFGHPDADNGYNRHTNLFVTQCLNYGIFKCLPFFEYNAVNASYVKYSRDDVSISVMELDTEKYKSFYLSNIHPDTFPTEALGKNGGVTITIWKIKDDPNLPDWVWLEGRDTYDDGLSGVRYEFNAIERARIPSLSGWVPGVKGFMITAGRSYNGTTWSYDETRNFKILNPDKYEYVKCIDTFSKCYEKEIKLNYTPESGYSSRVLIGLYGMTKNLSITLPSDDTYSVLSIGESSDGIKISEENPKRHDDQGNWEEANRNNVYDETKGYGTIVPPSGSPDDHGARLPYEQEYISMTSPFPNIQPKGGYYLSKDQLSSAFTSSHPGNDIVITGQGISEDYTCTALVFKPSYVEDGVTHKKSVFISTSMYGRAGMYAIFELSSSTGAHENWFDGTWIPKCRAIEYGKYINGTTEYNQKKITLPTCEDSDTLLLLIVCSYQSEPKIWVHDPDIAEKVSYLTIAAANNGDIRLYADDDNVFAGAIESGAILDQNGSPDPIATANRCRTKEFSKIYSPGTYAFTFEYTGSNVVARVFVYDTNETLLAKTDFKAPGGDFYIDGLALDNIVKFEFKRINDADIDPTIIQYPQFYRLESQPIINFEQGYLTAGILPQHTYPDIYADSTDPINSPYFISSGEYLYSDSDNDVLFIVNLSNIPDKVIVEGNEKDVVDHTCYLLVKYQRPEDVVVGSDHQTIYDTVYTSGEAFDVLKIHFDEKNIRYKVQLRMDVFYMEGDVKTPVRHELSPTDLQYVGACTLTERSYSPPNLAYKTYGHIERRVEFDDMESSQELFERAKKYMNQSQFDEMTIKAKALDLSIYGGSIDDIYYGDKTLVSSPPHGVYKYFTVKSQSIPFDNVANTTFEFGFDNKDTLSKLIRKEKSKW